MLLYSASNLLFAYTLGQTVTFTHSL